MSENDEQRNWLDYAFMYLGIVRDYMTPEQVEVVQYFLDGKFKKDDIQGENQTIRSRENNRRMVADWPMGVPKYKDSGGMDDYWNTRTDNKSIRNNI